MLGYFAFGSHGAYLGFGFGAVACVAVAKTLRSQRGQRMKEYGVAVDDVMRELTLPDRQHLRATGQVPPWFVDRVLAVRKPL